MSNDPDVLQLLGRIEGKLDQVIDAAKEHREDDKRRFGELYGDVARIDEEIAQAKGAKSVIVWLIGGGLTSLAASAYAVLKALGK